MCYYNYSDAQRAELWISCYFLQDFQSCALIGVSIIILIYQTGMWDVAQRSRKEAKLCHLVFCFFNHKQKRNRKERKKKVLTQGHHHGHGSKANKAALSGNGRSWSLHAGSSSLLGDNQLGDSGVLLYLSMSPKETFTVSSQSVHPHCYFAVSYAEYKCMNSAFLQG